MRKIYIAVVLFLLSFDASGQTLLNDLMDTSSSLSKGFLSLYQQYNWLRFSGYLQPQFQYAESKGAPSFNGGDFASNVDNRFMLRRGRMRIDYLRRNNEGYPSVQLVFQFDGTEKGFAIRDYWGRAFENRWHLFSLTAGMFARPFGYEVNLGSGDRESPERGRASQTLMKAERDLGAMVTLEPRKEGGKLHWLRADVAFVNGQGLSGTADYDSHKDVISRVYCKPYKLNRSGWLMSGGVSIYEGGIVNNNPLLYHEEGTALVHDSSADNVGKLAPRKYYGADAQLKIPNKKGKKGFTELRAEYLFGQQTGMLNSSESPGVLTGPLASRHFNAAYFYFLQSLGHPKHQLIIKYDWYDPNTDVAGTELSTALGHTAADVKFSTIGAGYLWYVNPNLRLMFYYEHPTNENTALAGYTEDLKDNLFTARVQFRF